MPAKQIHVLNPLSILFLSLISFVLAFIVNTWQYMLVLALCLVIYHLLSKALKWQVLLATAFVQFSVFTLVPLMHGHFFFGFIAHMFIVTFRFFPSLILVLCLAQYRGTELISAFRTLKLPEKIGLIIAVFFRYSSEFRQQMKMIREGAKTRGLALSIFRPIRSFEQVVVPLLYKGMHISTSLTATMITKGVLYKGEKTNYRNLRLGFLDYSLVVLSLVLLGVFVWLNYLV